MTYIPDISIPAAFVKLDDTMSDPDAFWNARDAQLLRLNHNAVLGQRLRRTIVAHRPMAGDGTLTNGVSIRGAAIVHTDRSRMLPFLVLPYYISSVHIQQVTVNVYAKAPNSAARIYAVIDRPSKIGLIDPTSYIDVNSSSYQDLSITIPVPRPAPTDTSRNALLYLYAHTPMYGSDTKTSTGGVSAVGYNWFEDTDTTFSAGAFVYDTSDLEVEPRLIVDKWTSGSIAHYEVRQPWNKQPAIGDVFASRGIDVITLQSYAAYELELSEFGAA